MSYLSHCLLTLFVGLVIGQNLTTFKRVEQNHNPTSDPLHNCRKKAIELIGVQLDAYNSLAVQCSSIIIRCCLPLFRTTRNGFPFAKEKYVPFQMHLDIVHFLENLGRTEKHLKSISDSYNYQNGSSRLIQYENYQNRFHIQSKTNITLRMKTKFPTQMHKIKKGTLKIEFARQREIYQEKLQHQILIKEIPHNKNHALYIVGGLFLLSSTITYILYLRYRLKLCNLKRTKIDLKNINLEQQLLRKKLHNLSQQISNGEDSDNKLRKRILDGKIYPLALKK